MKLFRPFIFDTALLIPTFCRFYIIFFKKGEILFKNLGMCNRKRDDRKHYFQVGAISLLQLEFRNILLFNIKHIT